MFIILSVKYGLSLHTGALILLTEPIHLTTHMLGGNWAGSYTRHLSYTMMTLYIKTTSYTAGQGANNVKAGFKHESIEKAQRTYRESIMLWTMEQETAEWFLQEKFQEPGAVLNNLKVTGLQGTIRLRSSPKCGRIRSGSRNCK
jgi:hypothetical protein